LSFEHDSQEEMMGKIGVVMKVGMKTQMAQMKTNQERLVTGLEKIKAKMVAV
jgi:hypothetical protein